MNPEDRPLSWRVADLERRVQALEKEKAQRDAYMNLEHALARYKRPAIRGIVRRQGDPL